ncbi:MAG: hypothetical protein R8P61_34315 [Bacteroidia bacterium]|nr:hypothetical protein [Bacteroidia bacterium]
MTRKTGNLIDELLEYTMEEMKLLKMMSKCRAEGNLEELMVCLEIIETQYAKAKPYRFRLEILSKIMGGPKVSIEN